MRTYRVADWMSTRCENCRYFDRIACSTEPSATSLLLGSTAQPLPISRCAPPAVGQIIADQQTSSQTC
jgi:hypothetical protein